MKRTSVTFTIGALLVAGTAVVAPAQASAFGTSHAPSVQVPTVHHSAGRTAHRATTSTNQQITAAVLRSPLLGDVKASNVGVSQIRFAASNKSWAAALVTPKNGQTDPAQVLLAKVSGSWKVRDLGTAGVGCGIAPATIRNQLGLHGPC